jgi:hypothetical protein
VVLANEMAVPASGGDRPVLTALSFVKITQASARACTGRHRRYRSRCNTQQVDGFLS